MSALRNKAAIVGIGATEFSKDSGRSELKLAVEAVLAALEDAGVAPEEVDGISTFTADNNAETEVFRAIGGRNLKFFSRIHYGGGAGCGTLLHAAMAIVAGVSEVCVVYRAMNERSQFRFGQPMAVHGLMAEGALMAYHGFHGLSTAGAFLGMMMRRYMHETGASSDDFATLSVSARNYAATNPAAFFYGRPITREDYFASRMIVDPFRLFDCCQESDGGVAFVITSAERARSLRRKPVMIRAAAQSAPRAMTALTNYYRQDIAPYDEVMLSAKQLYRAADLTPADIRMAIIYDHFVPTVLPSLEALQFCAKGEAKDFIKGGTIDIRGRLPLNTNGGQVGEAYIHGMNGIAEAVRQVRGTAVNQVDNVENVIVTSGSGVPTGGLILGAP
jgi:acetyl-CoA acetyltransferase